MCMIQEDIEHEREISLFRDYVGQSLWGIDSIMRQMVGVSNDIPQYVELAHPEKMIKDKRTAEQIKQDVLDKLTK